MDPHGDPIPTAEGTIARPTYASLATAQIGVPLTVARVIDQDPSFLSFVEAHELMPGRTAEILGREEGSDSVVVSNGSQTTTLGLRAASKILVDAR